jgi:catechol 2,3-dioxygenase
LNTWNRRSGNRAGRGLGWFELLVPDRASLGAARERFEAVDVEVTRTGDGDGFEVPDPDGILVRVGEA